jgi:formylglycine-generating enzyme required for sulfatase activity
MMSSFLELHHEASGMVIGTPENLKDLLYQAQPPQRVWWEKAAMELCLAPAGEFLMGSPDSDKNAEAREKPQHKVYLDSFYIGRYPVTNAQYALFATETLYRVPVRTEDWARPYNWDQQRRVPPPGKENHPVVLVSWDDARAYCAWAGLRLPAEAEWEKAAGWDVKARRTRLYPWGDEWDSRKCNTSEGGKGGTTAVGAYSPAGDNPCGCADMAGNVWEWTADGYDASYYGRSPDRNPTGPESGTYRVLRGGSWYFSQGGVRVSARGFARPGYFRDAVGFRVVVAPI